MGDREGVVRWVAGSRVVAAPVTYLCANAAASHQTWRCSVFWPVAVDIS